MTSTDLRSIIFYMNAIQKYLRDGNSIESLSEKYALKLRYHPEYQNLLLLKYDQIESHPDNDPIVVCGRGLIIDINNEFEVVNWPFNRFFNYGQGIAAEIDWSTTRITTKLDGSLMCMWNYADKWHCSTSGSPAAEGNVYGCDFNFSELFWKTFAKAEFVLPDDPDLCFMFELTAPQNRIVVVYDKPQLTLIGVRNRKTGEEFLPDSFPQYNPVKTFKFNGIENIIASLKDVSPVVMEGYVVSSDSRDEYGGYKRIKVKSAQYVALHNLRDSWSPRRVVEIVRAGEISEIVAYFKEYAEQLNETKIKYESFVYQLESVYNECKHIENQKEFALKIYSLGAIVPAALFQIRTGKIQSIKQYLSTMNIKTLMDALKIKDAAEAIKIIG